MTNTTIITIYNMLHNHSQNNNVLNRNNELYKLGIEIDLRNRDNDISLREIILELKDNLETLITEGVEGYKGYPLNCIFNMIVTTFQKKGMTASTLQKIHDIFSNPDLEKYKFNVNRKDSFYYTELARQYAAEKQDSSAEKALETMKINDAIQIIESNIESDRVRQYIIRSSSELERLETRERRDKQESEKIKIPMPDWIDQEQGGAESETFFSILKFISVLKECSKRVFRYPPGSDDDDKYYAEGITTLAKCFEPGTDMKFARDVFSYLDIGYEMDAQSIHSAKSKSKIVTKPSGRLRGMTREQIPIIREKFWILAQDIIYKLPGLSHFSLYLHKDQKPFTADGHINRHDKLSESAFGNGSLCHTDSR